MNNNLLRDQGLTIMMIGLVLLAVAGQGRAEEENEAQEAANHAARQEALYKAGALRLPVNSDISARTQAFERRDAASSVAAVASAVVVAAAPRAATTDVSTARAGLRIGF